MGEQTIFRYKMEPAVAAGAPGTARLALWAACRVRPRSSARAPIRWPMRKAGDPGSALSASFGPRSAAVPGHPLTQLPQRSDLGDETTLQTKPMRDPGS